MTADDDDRHITENARRWRTRWLDDKELAVIEKRQGFGPAILGYFNVICTYNDGSMQTVELTIEPNVCVGPAGKLFPGAAWRNDTWEGHQDHGEEIAYAINEGRVACGTFEDETESMQWRVENPDLLRAYGIIKD